MAQVTMTGTEYVELINKVKKLEVENDFLMQNLILGTLKVDPTNNYSTVRYEAQSSIPEGSKWDKYREMRISHMIECLEQNPLAVQLLFDSGELWISPDNGHFTSYNWDPNIEIRKRSKIVDEMCTQLDEGARLVEDLEETEEEA